MLFAMERPVVGGRMTRMPRIPLRQALALAGLHMLVLMVATWFASETLPGMGDPDWTPPVGSGVASVLVVVLAQPAMVLWMFLGGGPSFLDGFEWTLFVLNSLAWGGGLALLRAKWLQRRGPHGAAGSGPPDPASRAARRPDGAGHVAPPPPGRSRERRADGAPARPGGS